MRFRDVWSKRFARRTLACVLALPCMAGTSTMAAELADDLDGAPATIRATADPAVSASEPAAGRTKAHPNPRVKLSYRSFSISNVDGTSVPLSAYQLDLFPLSMRFFRGGLSVLAGKGHAAMENTPITLRYGLLGVTSGFQFPARVTPFVDGTLMGGVLTGTLDRAVTIPGTTASLDVASGTTGMYARGVDVGAEFYTIGRVFLSASLGWLRTTWLGPDIAALNTGAAANGLPLKTLTTDSLSLKLGVGF